MSEVQKIWEKFLRLVITNTFKDFLNNEQIQERVDWIMTKYTVISPEKLYKNILYSMNNNPLSKMAIGYKLHFLLDDYKSLFENPHTEEIDDNNLLSNDDSEILTGLVKSFSMSINHHIENLILKKITDDDSILNIYTYMNDLSSFYELTDLKHMDDMFLNNDLTIYHLTFSQILYMVVYNKNPVDESECDKKVAAFVKKSYPQRLNSMKKLKEVWEDIPLAYVNSSRIF